jgi:sulfotransferase
MEKLHYCLGLPRTCSSVLMNILNENPKFFTTGSCPTPYLIHACKEISQEVSEFIAMDKDVMNSAYLNFLRQGLKGWFESLTEKPIVFSKSRVWADYLRHTIAIDPNSKYIITLRDLREIICSFEILSDKYPNILSSDNSFQKRMQNYCTDLSSNLGRPLHMLPGVLDFVKRFPNNFFILRQEDFNQNPQEILKILYNFLEEPYFEHDLDNIPSPDYYEHDSIYRALVYHKTGTKLKKIAPKWKEFMTFEQSQMIIQNNLWYYQTFYPEFL